MINIINPPLLPMPEGGLPNEVLECLNSWPEGTEAHFSEQHLINTLNRMCQEHGYGRVPQIAAALEEIWRNPEKGLEKWRTFYTQRMQDLQETIKFIQNRRSAKKKAERKTKPTPVVPDLNYGTMFIGLKMDERSTDIIHQWLLDCTNKKVYYGPALERPVPKPFLYLPVVYSGNDKLPLAELKTHLLGYSLNMRITLDDPRIMQLGETGNVSLVFKNEWIEERHAFWASKHPLFRKEIAKFRPRIPMSYSCSNISSSAWLKKLPIREITLVDEFSTSFDRKAFFKELKKHY